MHNKQYHNCIQGGPFRLRKSDPELKDEGNEHLTQESIVTDALPKSFVLTANIDTLPSRTVRFFANTDGNQEVTGDPLFEQPP